MDSHGDALDMDAAKRDPADLIRVLSQFKRQYDVRGLKPAQLVDTLALKHGWWKMGDELRSDVLLYADKKAAHRTIGALWQPFCELDVPKIRAEMHLWAPRFRDQLVALPRWGVGERAWARGRGVHGTGTCRERGCGGAGGQHTHSGGGREGERGASRSLAWVIASRMSSLKLSLSAASFWSSSS